jgi:WD40 repeat protein/serine/threonine protein kinase
MMPAGVSLVRDHSQATPQDAELAQVLDGYLADIEAGRAIDANRLLAEHPAIAERLRACLASLQLVEQATGALQAAPGGGVSPSPPTPEPGYLGDFHILREVGRGGMGVVYEAEQISLGRRVALKVLPFAAALDARQLQRFKNEAQAAAHLHHGNIVPVYYVGCERGVHFFAMQFIEGQTLAALVRERRRLAGLEVSEGPVDTGGGSSPSDQPTGSYNPLSPAGQKSLAETASQPGAVLPTEHSDRQPAFFGTAVALGIQAAQALEHAHQLGVVHRDIKPANLLIDGRGILWVTDFGLAQVQSEAGLTLTGDVVGTLRYMSPEQALGKRGLVDHRADIYSLGVTLYEWLTLQPAFPGRDREELLRQVVSEEPAPPRRLNKAIPVELETIVLKAVEKDPEARYATAQELADDLRRFLEDRPIRARPPTWRQRLGKWSRRHRSVLATLLVAAVTALLGLLVAGVWFTLRLQDERDNAWDQERRAQTERDKARAEYARAEAEYQRARRHLYVAHIHLADRALQDGDIERVRELLTGAGCPEDLRGWEWYYLRGRCRLDRVTLTGPGRSTFPMAYSPDGRRLASAEPGGTVLLWDPASGRKVHTLKGHARPVWSLAFHPDGRRLFSVAPEEKSKNVWEVNLKVWDTVAGKELRSFERREGYPSRMILSPDGRQVAVVTKGRRVKLWEVKLWDTATGKDIRTLGVHSNGIWNNLAFSRDGRRLAVACMDKSAWVWDTTDGSRVCTLRGHKNTVQGLALSPDGKLLATGTSGHEEVRIWDVSTCQVRATLPAYTRYPACSFSPDGRHLATSSERDSTVRLWDVASGRTTLILREQTGMLFSPDGRHLATVGTTGAVNLWDLASRQPEVRTLEAGGGTILGSLAFRPNGRELAASSEITVHLWDPASGRPTRTLFQQVTIWNHPPNRMVYQQVPGVLRSVAFSPDGRWLAGTTRHLHIFLWDAASGRPVRTLGWPGPLAFNMYMGGGYQLGGVAFRPDSRLLAVAGFDSLVRLWDPATGKEVRILRGHNFPVLSVAFHPDGRRLASAGAEIKIWDTVSGKEVRTIKGHRGKVWSVAFSRDGSWLASASEDRTVKLWDAASGKEIYTLRGHMDGVGSVAFSPDGRRLASASSDGTVKLWDPKSGLEVLTLPGHAALSAVAFSSDGERLASAGEGGAVQLWEIKAERKR